MAELDSLPPPYTHTDTQLTHSLSRGTLIHLHWVVFSFLQRLATQWLKKSTFGIKQHKQTVMWEETFNSITHKDRGLWINYIWCLNERSVLLELAEACMTVLCCVTLRTARSGLTVPLSWWKPTPTAIQPKVAMKSGSIWSRASTFPSMEGGDCSG